MLVEKSGVSFAEDALSSSYYTTGGSSDSVGTDSSDSLFSLATSNDSSTSQKRRGFLGFLDWFKFGVSEEKKQDKDTVDEIMKCFKKNDVAGMEKFILPDISVQCASEEGLWWDDGDVLPENQMPSIAPVPKDTPHVKKFLSQVAPKVRKAVRFEMDYTPEEKENRPFTPLFTSTPKQNDEDNSSDDEELAPLRDIDSNTVVNPLNNTSSILLAHNSVMDTWNKSRDATSKALTIAKSEKSQDNNYRIFYDDTDEEEVVENPPSIDATPSRRTFVVSTESSAESKTLHEQSFELDQDSSTDSSVILGIDRIEDYIRALEEDVITANRIGREQDLVRARGSVRHAQMLQEKFEQMQRTINEMCAKLKTLESDKNAGGDHSNYSGLLEDSYWAANFGPEEGSFDGYQL